MHGAPGEGFIPFAAAHSTPALCVPQRLDRVHLRGAPVAPVRKRHAGRYVRHTGDRPPPAVSENEKAAYRAIAKAFDFNVRPSLRIGP
jgi:hypothetical protein